MAEPKKPAKPQAAYEKTAATAATKAKIKAALAKFMGAK